MLISTIEQFVAIIPTAAGTEFNAIQPFLIESENQLVGLFIGEDLFSYVESRQTDSRLKSTFIRLLCLQAYENAIPFADLIQTPNGFGIVSNSNIAPASKERVERLREWVSMQIDTNTDLFIQLILDDAMALTEWTKFSDFTSFTDCLFLTGRDFSNYVQCSGSKRKSFIDTKSKLLAWQTNILEKIISAAYMSQLIEEIRKNKCTPGAENVIDHCKMILGQLAQSNEDEAVKVCNTLSNILDLNLETYKTYASSPEYALKIAPKYVNKSSDSTFFFG